MIWVIIQVISVIFHILYEGRNHVCSAHHYTPSNYLWQAFNKIEEWIKLIVNQHSFSRSLTYAISPLIFFYQWVHIQDFVDVVTISWLLTLKPDKQFQFPFLLRSHWSHVCRRFFLTKETFWCFLMTLHNSETKRFQCKHTDGEITNSEPWFPIKWSL